LALADQGAAAAGLNFLQFPLPMLNLQDFTQLDATTEHTVFFMTSALKNAAADRLHYVPIHMRRVFDFLLDDPVDIALVQVARDRHGDLRLAANADFVDAVFADRKTVVVAQVNEGFVAPAGAPLLDRADYLVRGATVIPEFVAGGAATELDDATRAIGENVASLIQDGDCLQTGIGAIPAAVLASLGDKRDLGFHGGLIDDGVYALIEQGVMTGAKKNIDKGLHTAGIVLGSAALLDKLGRDSSVRLVGANQTHESSVIAALDNFVSLNSAVQVDLLGQINGEYAGGRQISGTGGSVDFMRSARASAGGRSIVAMPATARGGSISRVVSRVEMTTALRTDIDIVVTEHGIAYLRDQSITERARRVAAIAAPEFRKELLV